MRGWSVPQAPVGAPRGTRLCPHLRPGPRCAGPHRPAAGRRLQAARHFLLRPDALGAPQSFHTDQVSVGERFRLCSPPQWGRHSRDSVVALPLLEAAPGGARSWCGPWPGGSAARSPAAAAVLGEQAHSRALRGTQEAPKGLVSSKGGNGVQSSSGNVYFRYKTLLL